MTTTTWVLDSNSRYEISSKDHLLQIMNMGALFTDAGSAPVDYMTSSYIQTTDIDLFGETVIPIGSSTTPFEGTFDGGNNKILNWSLSGTFEYSGLFGYCSETVLKNIVLAGVWFLDESTSTTTVAAGFLVGMVTGTSSTNSEIYNVTTEFESGTIYKGHSNENYVGTLIGRIFRGVVQAITLGGVLSTCEGPSSIGGVVGETNKSTVFMLRNIATFENGIVGQNAAGLFVRMRDSHVSYVMNAMKGDITGTRSAGGIVYYMYPYFDTLDVWVNAMTGSIIGSVGSNGCYGICYKIEPTQSAVLMTRVMVYMKGYIYSDNGYDNDNALVLSPTPSGSNAIRISNSIVSINGSVNIIGQEDRSNLFHTVVSDYSFGMNVTSTDYGTNPALSGYTYNSEFGDLPYVPFVGTDAGGTTHKWEFVFPNVSGKAAYSAYSDIAVSSAKTVNVPTRVEFDLPESNTVEYATFFKQSSSEAYIDDSLTVLDSDVSAVYDYTGTNQKFPAPIQVIMYTVLADIIWTAIPAASSYRLTYVKDAGVEVELVASTTGTQTIVHKIVPGSSYEVRLYTDLDLLTPARSVSGVAPLVDVTSVGDVMHRIGNDLTLLPDESISLIAQYIPSSTTTGTKITTVLGKASVVRNSDNITIPSAGGALLTEFSDSLGSEQSITVTLPDASSTTLSYVDANDTILAESVEYGAGEYFVVGEYKVEVQKLVD